MFEIVIISGKGGTGKTSLTGALAHLATDTILCDLDVDAPDLPLLLQPAIRQREAFYAGHEAVIDQQACTNCGQCLELCQFAAIRQVDHSYQVVPWRCEGCKVCVVLCPAAAIRFPERHCGEWYISSTRSGTLVHAQLRPGAENSGKLVMLLKQQSRLLAQAEGASFILADGAPGIGCPVISSLSGANLAVVITEPTPSGRHDLERVVSLTLHFRIATAVILNKADLHPAEAERLAGFCRDQDIPLVARLPFDPRVTQAMVQGRVVTELPDNPFSQALAEAWQQITTLARGAAG